MARTALSTRCGSCFRDLASEPEGLEQAVDPDPGREAIVIPQLELGVFAGLRQSFEQADSAGDLGQAAAAVVDSPRNDLEAQGGRRLDHQPEHGRLEERTQGIDVVDEQPLQVGIRVENLCQHAIAQQVGHLVEVAGGIEPLDRQVVGVIGSLALAPGPIEDRAAAGVAHLLLVVIQSLVAGLFPEEASGRGPSGSAAGRSTGRARGRPGRRGRSCSRTSRWRSMAECVR